VVAHRVAACGAPTRLSVAGKSYRDLAGAAKYNINVVMPVGGQSIFYSDWIAPSNTNGQRTIYAWDTFLTENLRGPCAIGSGHQFRLTFPFRDDIFERTR
jgi:hypothetical protein